MPEKTSQFRKAIYDFLAAEGFELTPERHKALKPLLKNVEEHPVQPPSPKDPLKHEVVCPKCRGVHTFMGKAFHKYKQKINKAAQRLQQTAVETPVDWFEGLLARAERADTEAKDNKVYLAEINGLIGYAHSAEVMVPKEKPKAE